MRGGVLAGFRCNIKTAILGQLLSLTLLVGPTSLTAKLQLNISHEAAANLLRRDVASQTGLRHLASCGF